MAKYLLMSILVAILLAQFTESRPAYQMLEPKAGYIPVYIRLGDQPLSEINPILAEAFREHGISARNIKDEPVSVPDSPKVSLLSSKEGSTDGVTKIFPAGPFIPDQVSAVVESKKPAEEATTIQNL